MTLPLTINPPLNVSLVTDGAGLEKVRLFLSSIPEAERILGWDKETTCVKDFYNRRDRTWQIGNRNEQFVVDLLAFTDGDARQLDAEQGSYGVRLGSGLRTVCDIFSPVLCSNDYLKAGVNLGFEYEQSYWCFGQRTWHFFSCDMVERLIYAGMHSLKDYPFFSMEAMIARYFKRAVDKTLQTSFDLSSPLTQAQIEYAAMDTVLPLALRRKQLEIIRRDNLVEISDIENNAIGAFIDMHVHGLRLDTEKWNGIEAANRVEFEKVIHEELDPVFLPVVGTKINVVTDEQVELAKLRWKAYTEVSQAEKDLKQEAKLSKDPEHKTLILARQDRLALERLAKKDKLKAETSTLGKTRTKQKKISEKCEGDALINYASGPQVLEIFNQLPGLKDLDDTDDESLEKLKSIPVIASFQKYRKLAKKLKTYGKTWTRTWITSPGAKVAGQPQEGWLHPGDNRLHSRFNQLDAATGRSTSSQPNDQNIPTESEVRACFIADPPDAEEPEGYKLITIDMAGAELRIIAELANAKSWLDAFLRDEDIHSVGTEILYSEQWAKRALSNCAYYKLKPNGEPAREKCECPEHKKLRNLTKSTNFMLAYGGVAHTLSERIGVSLEEAEKIMALHQSKFPDIWDYLDKSGKQAQVTKEARSMFNRRRMFPEPTWELAKTNIIEFARSGRDEDKRWEIYMRCHPYEFGFNRTKWTDALWEKAVEQWTAQFVESNGKPPTKDELYDGTHKDKPDQWHISSMMKSMFSRIERQGKNHCVQATNADIAKLAMSAACDSIENKPFLWHTLPQYNSKLLAFIHDELIIQAPARLADDVAKLAGDAFRRAAAEKFKVIEMKFDYKIKDYWCK